MADMALEETQHELAPGSVRPCPGLGVRRLGGAADLGQPTMASNCHSHTVY
jgi:hypothetical protein